MWVAEGVQTATPAPPGAVAAEAAPRVVAVVVTHDRPALLAECLRALRDQQRPPDLVIVVDNASGPETAATIAGFEAVQTLRLEENGGGAAGFCAGMAAALDAGADFVWLMDDDGRPEGPSCLRRLLGVAELLDADMTAPLVIDAANPQRLAFPVRLAGRTLFTPEAVAHRPAIEGFAHLFNGVLVSAALLARIGPPDARFFIRGDEVEFLYRARRAGARIVLHTATRFIHPGSEPEIHPILFGAFYAVVPPPGIKRHCQFRNRAWIFRRYGMWAFLAADVVRYGWYFLVTCRDPRGMADWVAATLDGLRGGFMRGPEAEADARDSPRAGPVSLRARRT